MLDDGGAQQQVLMDLHQQLLLQPPMHFCTLPITKYKMIPIPNTPTKIPNLTEAYGSTFALHSVLHCS